MSTRRLNVEVPTEVFDHFKETCAKNHVLMKDEIFKFICASLDGVAPTEIKKAETSEEAFEKELDGSVPPFIKESVKKEDLEAKMKPILEMIEGLTSVSKELQEWREGFRVWQDGKFEALDGKIEALDGKFKVVANFIENLIYLSMKTHSGVKPCADDITGLALLRNEQAPSTSGLNRDQLGDLFLKGMKTKAF